MESSTRTAQITKVLDAERLMEVLDESVPIEKVVADLFHTGEELAEAVDIREYDSWDDFVNAHQQGESAIARLEGPSTIDDESVVVLHECPMAEEMKKLLVDGETPEFHKSIVEGYKEQNPGSNALLHPGCIAHQVGRQLIIRQVSIGGEHCLNFHQLACRSGSTGFVVYDDKGLETIGMSRETASKLIDGYACLYVIVKTNQT